MSRLRFTLRSLLAVIAAVAALVWLGSAVHEHYNTIALDDAITILNAAHDQHALGRTQLPLTEEEVVAAIESKLPLKGAPAATHLYERIVRSRRLPATAKLRSFATTQGHEHLWLVVLEVMTAENMGYGLPLRRTPLGPADPEPPPEGKPSLRTPC